MTVLSGQAFAKVNLGLRILDRRPDGFHELRTVFQTISLADWIEVGFEPAAETVVTLRCSDPELESDDNLACRAARELLQRVETTGKVSIHLERRRFGRRVLGRRGGLDRARRAPAGAPAGCGGPVSSLRPRQRCAFLLNRGAGGRRRAW